MEEKKWTMTSRKETSLMVLAKNGKNRIKEICGIKAGVLL